MINNIVVEVEARSDTGKNACRRMRRAGRIPGIVYGLDRPPFAVAVSPRRLEEILRLESGRNTIFNLSLVGENRSRAAMIRELQRDPVTEEMVHVDLVRVDLEKRVTVNVPIRIIGIPEGVKNQGGTLEFLARRVEVECLPAAIPEHFDVDVSALHINQHVSVSDLPIGEGIELLTDADTIVATVAPPRVEAEPVPAEAAAEPEAVEGEPEVIKKGKEGESEGAAPGKGD